MNSPLPKSEKLHLTTKLAYGAGDLGPAITANILVFYLLFFLTNVAGLPAGLAGIVLMIGKIADAINDPIVGMMSDRTHSPWGRRLPWMLWGAIPFGLLYIFQWFIPHFNIPFRLLYIFQRFISHFSEDITLNNWGLFAYYVLIGILFNIAFTAVNLPYTALTPELTQDYDDRTNLNSFRFAFSLGGGILSLILAFLIFKAYPNENDVTRYIILGLFCSILSIISIFWCVLRIQERGATPILNSSQKKQLGMVLMVISGIFAVYSLSRLLTLKTLDYLGIFALIITLLLIGFGLTLIYGVTETHLVDEYALIERSEADTEPHISYGEQLRIVFRNRAFLYVVGIYLCSWLAVQLTASILIYYVVSCMGLSESRFSLVALLVQGTALLMLFIWQKLSEKIGKKAVYFMGIIVWFIAQTGLFFLPSEKANLIYILAAFAGVGVSVAYLIPWSMLPDVIELDELETGKRREGVFYAFMVLLQKFGLAFALFIVGIALQTAGFQERIPGQPIPIQPESALFAIRIAISPIPAFLLIIGVILAYFYPITREVHDQIRLKLQERNLKNNE